MSYLDKLKPIQAQNPQAGSGAVGGGYKQKLKPIQTAAPTETRESRMAQGLPVGMGDRVQPTATGSLIRDIARPFAKVGSSLNALRQVTKGVPMNQIQPERTNYFGDVKRIGAGFDVTKGLTPENVGAVKEAVGTGVELSSFLPVGTGAKVMANIARQPFKQGVMQSAKTLGREGFVQGALGSGGRAIQEGDNAGQILGKSLLGGGIGAVGGGILGAGTSAISRMFTRTPASFIDQKVDKNIRNALAGVTGDLDMLETSAVRAKNALQRLVNDKTIQIPDTSKPLGSGAKKAFDIRKTTPNEFISAIESQAQNIAQIGRSSAEEASRMGRMVDTIKTQEVIANAMNTGEISVPRAKRFMLEIQALKNDPVKAHDWVQNVNIKYAPKYENGKITHTTESRMADAIAQTLRQELDRNVYRTEYAQAYADNRALKKLFVAVAKKANKKADFGDITSDAGLDAAISILTGNPLYMARTLADSVFKGIVRNIRNQSGFKGMVKAGKLSQFNVQLKGNKPIPLGKKSASKLEAEEIARIQGQKGGQQKPNMEAGFITPKTAIFGAGLTGAGSLLTKIKKNKKDKKIEQVPQPLKPVETKNTFDRQDFSQRIVGIENEGELARGENVYKTIGVTGDLGKYQVSPQTLKSWSKAWLNKEYTPQEFLNDPEAQEKFFNNFLDVVERLQLTPEEAAITWHMGWGELGNMKPREVRDREFRQGLTERMKTNTAKNYLSKFSK